MINLMVWQLEESRTQRREGAKDEGARDEGAKDEGAKDEGTKDMLGKDSLRLCALARDNSKSIDHPRYSSLDEFLAKVDQQAESTIGQP